MAMTLITTGTADDDDEISFTSSIDSTYKLYIFKFIDINAKSDEALFSWNASTDGGSNWGVTKSSTAFYVEHAEADGSENLGYSTAADRAQHDAYQSIGRGLGSGADESLAGYLYLFNPSGTTYVKHFYALGTFLYFGDESLQYDTAGYLNTTSAINALNFHCTGDDAKMDGTIKMYGVG